jgi:putative acetyltransferase
VIRNFKESDIHDIETVYEKSNNALALKVTSGFFKKDKKKFTSSTLRSCKNSVYELEGKVVGVISTSADCIEGLFVLPEFWNRGIGTELLNYATAGKDEVFLQVYTDNKRALNFYRKHGFEITGNGVCQMTDLPYFEMRKDLKKLRF